MAENSPEKVAQIDSFNVQGSKFGATTSSILQCSSKTAENTRSASSETETVMATNYLIQTFECVFKIAMTKGFVGQISYSRDFCRRRLPGVGAILTTMLKLNL